METSGRRFLTGVNAVYFSFSSAAMAGRKTK